MNKEEVLRHAFPVLKRLTDQGYEAYLVGGTVRDLLRNKITYPLDLDITTNASPDEVIALFDNVNLIGRDFGTVQVFLNGDNFEITTYRSESGYTDKRHPEEVEYVSDLKTDLSRRDFRMNAIVMDINGEIQDFYDGLTDIKNHHIRSIGDPNKRFEEDQLRKWRAIRLAAQLGFTVDPEITQTIIYDPDTNEVSMERIRDELIKTLLSKKINWGGYLLVRTSLYPRLLKRIGIDIGERISDIQDLIEPFEVVYQLEPELIPRLCALLLLFEPREQELFLEELKFPKKVIRSCIKIVSYFWITQEDGIVEYKKMMADLSESELDYLLNLQEAAAIVDHDRDRIKMIQQTKEMAKTILKNKEPIRVKDLAVSGTDLKEMGLEGKEIGEALDFLLEKVYLEPELNEKEKLTKLIGETYETNLTN